MDVMQHIRARGLKATPVRLKVLEVLHNDQLAFSHAELESAFDKVDRITLYRALNDFEEAGLVHKVVDTAGITRFAMCKDSCTEEHHKDNHVHFDCQQCHKMYCLEKVLTPDIKTPKGFKTESINIVVQGICRNCAEA